MTNVRIFRKQDTPEFISMTITAPEDFKEALKSMDVETMGDFYQKLDDEDFRAARKFFRTDSRHRQFVKWCEKQWRVYERWQQRFPAQGPRS
jgi:SpoVK/Ycf46/Vps4 family AAA+-type ATPase